MHGRTSGDSNREKSGRRSCNRADRDIDAHRLDSAEHTYREIHQALLRHPEPPQQRRHLAVTYHQLGWLAQERGTWIRPRTGTTGP
jgi:hypothetical protein